MTSEQVQAYLENVGLRSPLVERGVDIVDKWESLYGARPIDIVVDDERDESNARVYKDLWGLYPDFVVEQYTWTAGNFRGDVVSLESGIVRFEYTVRDYNFVEATDASRMTLEVDFQARVAGTVNVSGANCDHLLRLYREYFVPNLAGVRRPTAPEVAGA